MEANNNHNVFPMNNKDYRPFSASIYTFFNDFEDNNPGYGLVPMHVRMLAIYLCTAPERHKSGLITINVRAIHQNLGLSRELLFPTLEQLAEIPYTSSYRNYSGNFLTIENGKVFMPFIADLTLAGKENKWLNKNIYQPIEDNEINTKNTPVIFDSYCEFWSEEIYQYRENKNFTKSKKETTEQPQPEQQEYNLAQIIATAAKQISGTSESNVLEAQETEPSCNIEPKTTTTISQKERIVPLQNPTITQNVPINGLRFTPA